MPGLEPGIQAAPSMIVLRAPALDTRVKPAHYEAESGALIFGRRLQAVVICSVVYPKFIITTSSHNNRDSGRGPKLALSTE